MHIMSFEEFLENGKPEMSVIIQRVADRYKKNYKNTLKRQHVPEYQYKNLCQKAWKVFRKTKDFDAAVKKEMLPFSEQESKAMVKKFLADIGYVFSEEEIMGVIRKTQNQRDIMNRVVQVLAEKIAGGYGGQ